jgi:probable HAF family extracellular repeat protein
LAINGTTAFAINDAGQIVGNYADANFNNHAFLFSGGVYTTIDDPLATFSTQALGINDLGQIVGRYTDATGTHGFLFSGGAYTTLDDPLAVNVTSASGINDMGQIVGTYDSGGAHSHGYLLTIAPNPPPPAGSTVSMILRGSNASPAVMGQYEIYDIGNNAILAAYQLGQVGTDWQFNGLGGVGGGNTTMLLRNSGTGGFELYGISNNNIVTAAFLGTVGLDWQFAGFGNFSSLGQSDMILRNGNTGALQVYDIANSQITNTASLGTVGLDWQVGGFGNFSSRGERHDHAQRHDRRIAGLRYRSQSSHRYGLHGHGRAGLADQRRRQF